MQPLMGPYQQHLIVIFRNIKNLNYSYYLKLVYYKYKLKSSGSDCAESTDLDIMFMIM